MNFICTMNQPIIMKFPYEVPNFIIFVPIKNTFAKKRNLFGLRMHHEGFIPPILPLPRK